ncbi:MAG: 50S ribosomal protein L18 [Acidobacteriota bacterium]|nr:50S ribosomal protein L18 [Acidobacteriota bacterium]
MKTKKDKRVRIHLRQRKRMSGTAERPRLAVYRSLAHTYAQVIDDMSGATLASASSTEPDIKGAFGAEAKGGNTAGATAIGKAIAERAKEKGITRVVFDRGGNLYHGRVRAVAEAAREAGLEF